MRWLQRETANWICGVLGFGMLLSSPIPAGAVPTNLVADPHFESGVAGFFAQDASSSVTQSAEAPLEGAHSLRVAIAGYGNNIGSFFPMAGVVATSFTVSAHLRSDVASGSSLQFCAMAYYSSGGIALKCTSVSGAAGDKGVITIQLGLDPAKPLDTVQVRLSQGGTDPVRFTLDDAGAYLSPASDGGGGSARRR